MKVLESVIRRLGETTELVHRSRIEAAYIGQRERCAKAIDRMILDLQKGTAWTREDDHRPPDSEKAAVIANLQEAARRIRALPTGPNPKPRGSR